MRHAYDAPPERVHAVMTDPAYLRDKLASVGGPGAELVSHTANGSSLTIVQRQGVPADALPSALRPFVPGDLAIERTEVWTGPTDGTIDVTITAAPGSVSGTIHVAPEGDGSLVVIWIDASVPVPLLGGRIERTITDNIEKLGDVEHAFTREWMRDHPA